MSQDSLGDVPAFEHGFLDVLIGLAAGRPSLPPHGRRRREEREARQWNSGSAGVPGCSHAPRREVFLADCRLATSCGHRVAIGRYMHSSQLLCGIAGKKLRI